MDIPIHIYTLSQILFFTHVNAYIPVCSRLYTEREHRNEVSFYDELGYKRKSDKLLEILQGSATS